MTKVKICTSEGDMLADLYNDATPNTVNNFLSLISKNFYDNTSFHRVIPNFMAQAGCPFGNGTGGPGYCIPCELNNDKQFHDRGVLSMAHAGRDTGGSQFFICYGRFGTAHLDGNHTCFGKLIDGFDTLDKIKQGTKIISMEIME